MHGFWVYDQNIVNAETFAADLHITEPDEIAIYLRIFGEMAKIAQYGSEARSIILRVQAEWSGDAP